MKELAGKYIVLAAEINKNKPNFIYNCKLISADENEIVIDDAKLGIINLPRCCIKDYREMNRMDMIELAGKFDEWALRLKVKQIDDKISKRFHNLQAEFKKMIGLK